MTPQDALIIPEYVRMFNRGLDQLSAFYGPDHLQSVRDYHNERSMVERLGKSIYDTYVGHFLGDQLDGLLIEGHDNLDGRRTVIKWAVADPQGRGTGRELIQDCIYRSRSSCKEVIALGVSVENTAAIRLYERLGFVHGDTFREGRMLQMGYRKK